MAVYLKLETRQKAVPLRFILLIIVKIRQYFFQLWTCIHCITTVQGDEKSFYRFRLGSHKVIPAFEEAVSGMALGSIRRIIVPSDLGYPDNDYNKSGPRPTTFSGQ